MTFLKELTDPRKRLVSRDYDFTDILVIAICAIICGAGTWEEMEAFGEEKEDWFRTFLELPSGIPSHDTFYRKRKRAGWSNNYLAQGVALKL